MVVPEGKRTDWEGFTMKEVSAEVEQMINQGAGILHWLPDDPANPFVSGRVAKGPLPKNTVAQCVAAAEAAISQQYSTLTLLDGMQRIAAATAAGTLASIPKTVAVATWVQTVKQTALARSTSFPAPPPYTASQLLSE